MGVKNSIIGYCSNPKLVGTNSGEFIIENNSILVDEFQYAELGHDDWLYLFGEKNSQKLNWLSLRENKIDPQIFEVICKCIETSTSITYLDLSSNLLCHNNIKSLANAFIKNTSVETLILNGNRMEYQDIFILVEGLKNLRTLKKLYLCENFIKDDSIQLICNLAKMNQTITHLNISKNSLTLLGFRYIADLIRDCPYLNWLDLSKNKINETAIIRLVKVSSELDKITAYVTQDKNVVPLLKKAQLENRSEKIIFYDSSSGFLMQLQEKSSNPHEKGTSLTMYGNKENMRSIYV